MGGRSNVLDTPFKELLGYLITNLEEANAEAKKEQMDYYMNFIAMLNSNSPQSKEQSKKIEQFMKAIKPQEERKSKVPSGKPKWDKRVQEKIERRKALEKAQQ